MSLQSTNQLEKYAKYEIKSPFKSTVKVWLKVRLKVLVK